MSKHATGYFVNIIYFGIKITIKSPFHVFTLYADLNIAGDKYHRKSDIHKHICISLWNVEAENVSPAECSNAIEWPLKYIEGLGIATVSTLV